LERAFFKEDRCFASKHSASWKDVGVFLRVGSSKLQIACHLENQVNYCIFPPAFHETVVMIRSINIFFATVEGDLMMFFIGEIF